MPDDDWGYGVSPSVIRFGDACGQNFFVHFVLACVYGFAVTLGILFVIFIVPRRPRLASAFFLLNNLDQGEAAFRNGDREADVVDDFFIRILVWVTGHEYNELVIMSQGLLMVLFAMSVIGLALHFGWLFLESKRPGMILDELRTKLVETRAWTESEEDRAEIDQYLGGIETRLKRDLVQARCGVLPNQDKDWPRVVAAVLVARIQAERRGVFPIPQLGGVETSTKKIDEVQAVKVKLSSGKTTLAPAVSQGEIIKSGDTYWVGCLRKPQLEEIKTSLGHLFDKLATDGVTEVCMPRIYSSISDLSWNKLEGIIGALSSEKNIKVTVCKGVDEAYDSFPKTLNTSCLVAEESDDDDVQPFKDDDVDESESSGRASAAVSQLKKGLSKKEHRNGRGAKAEGIRDYEEDKGLDSGSGFSLRKRDNPPPGKKKPQQQVAAPVTKGSLDSVSYSGILKKVVPRVAANSQVPTA